MTEISMVRGDTLQLSINSIKTQDGEDYILSDTDVIYVDVKKYQGDKTPVFTKSVTADDYVNGALPITILPDDTANLDVAEYFFDARLFINNDNIYTIVPMTRLKIVRNITDIPGGGGNVIS